MKIKDLVKDETMSTQEMNELTGGMSGWIIPVISGYFLSKGADAPQDWFKGRLIIIPVYGEDPTAHVENLSFVSK